MCQKCLDAVKRHYPDLKGKEISDLLIGATCFPFGKPEDVEANLVELKENTDGTLGAALQFADDQLSRQLAESARQENEK